MTLTEQWRKGELPEGFYYVADGAEVTIDYYLCDYWERHFDSDVQEVLAPVPSYEEYLTMKDCAKIVYEAAERETKLKDLLKQSARYVYAARNTIHDRFAGATPEQMEMLINQIDNAIGEKK